MRKFSILTKIIACTLLLTFLAQDIVWANPDALSGRGANSSLSIESKFKPMDTGTQDPATLNRNHLEVVLNLITASMPTTIELRLFDTDGSPVKRVYDFSNKYQEKGKWIVPCAVVNEISGLSKSYEAVIDPVAKAIELREFNIKAIAPSETIQVAAAPVKEDPSELIRRLADGHEISKIADYLAGKDVSDPSMATVIDAAITCSYDPSKEPCRISHPATEAIAEACRKNPELVEIFADRIAIALNKGAYEGRHVISEIVLKLTHLSFETGENDFIRLLSRKMQDETKLVAALRECFASNFEMARSNWAPRDAKSDVALDDGKIVLRAINSNWYFIEVNGVLAGVVEAIRSADNTKMQVAINVFSDTNRGIGLNVMQWASSELGRGGIIERAYPANGANLDLFFSSKKAGILSSVEVLVTPKDSAIDSLTPWQKADSLDDVSRLSQEGKGNNIFVRGTVSGKPYSDLTPTGNTVSKVFDAMTGPLAGDSVSVDAALQFTKDSIPGKFISYNMVERDLNLLVYLGLLEKWPTEDTILYRAVKLSIFKMKAVKAILKSLSDTPSVKAQIDASSKISRIIEGRWLSSVIGEIIRAIKEFFSNIKRIEFRNPLVFVNLAGTDQTVPMLQWPIAMTMAKEGFQVPGTVPPAAEAVPVAAEQGEQITPNDAFIDKGDVDFAFNFDHGPAAGAFDSKQLGKRIDDLSIHTSTLNTPEMIMKILKDGSEGIIQYDLTKDHSKERSIPRNWGIRSANLLSDELRDPTAYTNIGQLEESVLRRRIATIVGAQDAAGRSPFLRLLEKIMADSRTNSARLFIGSKSGYFQVMDKNSKFPHQLDFVVVVKDTAADPYPMKYMKVSDSFIKGVQDCFPENVISEVRVRIVGVEAIRRAILVHDGFSDEKLLKERAVLQKLFIELYRSYFPANGNGLLNEGAITEGQDIIYSDLSWSSYAQSKRRQKILKDKGDRASNSERGELQDLNKVLEQISDTRKEFAGDLAVLDNHYAKELAVEFGRVNQDLASYKEQRSRLKQSDRSKELDTEIAELQASLKNVESRVNTCEQACSENRAKQLKSEKERLDAVDAEYKGNLNEEQLSHKKSYLKMYTAYIKAKGDLPLLKKQRDDITAEIAIKRVRVKEYSKDLDNILKMQEQLSRERDFLAQQLEDTSGYSLPVLGTIFQDRYIIISILGRGGFGAVYRARDLETGDDVAIKISAPEKKEYFMAMVREKDYTSNPAFRRAPIPIFVSEGSFGKFMYYVMSLEKGRTLREICDNIFDGVLKLDTWGKLVLMRAIAHLMTDFHEITKLIHRDIKPANIMIRTNDKGEFEIPNLPAGVRNDPKTAAREMPNWLVSDPVRVLGTESRIIDLGLARIGEVVYEKEGKESLVPLNIGTHTITGSQGAKGTPDYMAPEQVANTKGVKNSADVYSLGCIFYELLTDDLTPLESPDQGTFFNKMYLMDWKRTREPVWPNEGITRRRINSATMKWLKETGEKSLIKDLVAAKIIVTRDGKNVRWTDLEEGREAQGIDKNGVKYKFKWALGMEGQYIVFTNCKWNKNIVNNEKRLRKWLRKIKMTKADGSTRPIGQAEEDELVRMIVIPRVPDLLEALVIQMLSTNPDKRPSARMVFEELEKMLTAKPRESMRYLPPWMRRWKITQTFLYLVKNPAIPLMLVASGVGYYAYHLSLKRDELMIEKERQGVTVDISKSSTQANIDIAKQEAASVGVTDFTGTAEDIFKRVWAKKEANAQARVDALAAEAIKARADLDKAIAEKQKISDGMAAAVEALKKAVADADKAKSDAEMTKRSSEQIAKDLAELASKKKTLETDVTNAADRAKRSAELDQEILKKEAAKKNLDEETQKAGTSLASARSELELAFAKKEAVSLGLDASGTLAEIKARIEAKKKTQPSYIVSYLEAGRPNWLVRIAYSFWSIPHEIGNFVQACLTGRVNDIESIGFKNLFYGWEYKGMAPPCIGGTIVNLAIGAVLLNFFSADPFAISYNIVNLAFIIVEAAGFIELLNDRIDFGDISFRSPIRMAMTTAGTEVFAGLQSPIVFMEAASEGEGVRTDLPPTVPIVDPEYARLFVKEYYIALTFTKLTNDTVSNQKKAADTFKNVLKGKSDKWLQPYLMLEGNNAVLIFRNGANDLGIGSKTIAYKIPLEKKKFEYLKPFIMSHYRWAALNKINIPEEEYADKLDSLERIALASRSMDHTTHMDLPDVAQNLAGAATVTEDRLKNRQLSGADSVIIGLLASTKEAAMKIRSFMPEAALLGGSYKNFKILPFESARKFSNDLRSTLAAIKRVRQDWENAGRQVGEFIESHKGDGAAQEINALQGYLKEVEDILETCAGSIDKKNEGSAETVNSAELIERTLRSMRSATDRTSEEEIKISSARTTVTKKMSDGTTRDIEVKIYGLDDIRNFSIAGNWRALAFAVENALFGSMKAVDQADGAIELGVKLSCRDGQDYLDLVIKDHGKGIPAEDIKKISDASFTTTGGGTGWAFARRAIQDAKGTVSIASRTEGRNKGTDVSISWPVNKIAVVPAAPIAATLDAAKIKEPAIPAVKVDPAKERFLRNMNNIDEVGKNMVEGIISISISKKVVLAFDDNLGGLQARTILSVFAELEKLRDDERFKRILKNLQIVILPADQITGKAKGYKDEGAEVFIFARSTERQNLLGAEAIAHSTYIDEAQFPLYESGAYYPLAEIVTVSLAQYLDPRSIEELGTILKDMNITPAIKDGIYIFTILPPSERFDPASLLQRYARLKEVLRSA